MLIITCNGPGETAGWLRPLLAAIYSLQPAADVRIFYVPDDYATGEEPAYVRRLFPQAHVYDPRRYLQIALGGPSDLPKERATVLYLGGDLMHAARLHRRFGGALATYKFNRPRYAKETALTFAVDERDARGLVRSGLSRDRIRVVGNLAVDGALQESSQAPQTGAPEGGILFMPGSRRLEVRHMVPFFFTAAVFVRRIDPQVPIAFGISPFTDRSALREAIEGGGDWRFFAQAGKLLDQGHLCFATRDGAVQFPILESAIAAAAKAALAVTIPGTKVIELATVGTPVIACTPLNAAELIAINGPLTYLDRLGVLGALLKRRVVLAASARHPFHAQPNIDAGHTIVRELRGTLTPGRVARAALEALADCVWLQSSSHELRALYEKHAGAARRMASDLLAIA